MDFEVELLCWVRYKNKIVYINLLQITGPGFTQLTSQAHVVEVSEHSFVRGMFFFFLSEGCDKKNKTMMYFEVELLCWVRYKSRIYILNFTFLTDPNVLTNTENKNNSDHYLIKTTGK